MLYYKGDNLNDLSASAGCVLLLVAMLYRVTQASVIELLPQISSVKLK